MRMPCTILLGLRMSLMRFSDSTLCYMKVATYRTAIVDSYFMTPVELYSFAQEAGMLCAFLRHAQYDWNGMK